MEHQSRRLNNILLRTDSYKLSHWKQYPPGTSYYFGYKESRGGKYPKVVNFGLQYYLLEYMTQRVTTKKVEEAAKFAAKHGEPFNYEGWMYVVKEHDGRIPMKIKAPAEGEVIPVKNVMMTLESTDPKCFWVPSYFEALLLRTWFPETVATLSFHIKQTILDYLFKTADDPLAEIPFKLHDFGARGTSSSESAEVGGMAHLVNFQGSDTMEGIWTANSFYNCDMAGFSIPAAEHSTITMWERFRETEAYQNMLDQYGGDGKMLAVVSDSYDLFNACENIWGGTLKEQIMNSGSILIVRPDSGIPSEVVLKTLEILESKFGSTLNSKGYKVINRVRVIQGDGINHDSIIEILETITQAGFSTTNVAFGMGGALLQGVNRDTQKYAIKCSAAVVNNKLVEVYKDPITDPGKVSKKGILNLIKDIDDQGNAHFRTITEAEKLACESHMDNDALNTVYMNGEVLIEHNMADIRRRADSYLIIP